MRDVPKLSVQPFVIDVAEDVLDDLRRRLRRARLPEEMSDTPWQLGTDRAYLAELVDYWIADFDWRRIEAELNRFDQYTTEVDGLMTAAQYREFVAQEKA